MCTKIDEDGLILDSHDRHVYNPLWGRNRRSFRPIEWMRHSISNREVVVEDLSMVAMYSWSDVMGSCHQFVPTIVVAVASAEGVGFAQVKSDDVFHG